MMLLEYCLDDNTRCVMLEVHVLSVMRACGVRKHTTMGVRAVPYPHRLVQTLSKHTLFSLPISVSLQAAA